MAKRGRPRKAAAEAPATPAKRRRGRPSKAEQAERAAAEEAEDEVEEEVDELEDADADVEEDEYDEEGGEEGEYEEEEEGDEESGHVTPDDSFVVAFCSGEFEAIHAETEEDRRIAVLNQTERAAAVDDAIGLILGCRLYEIQENQLWDDGTKFQEDDGTLRPYSGFFEWLSANYGIKKSRASYLIRLFKVFGVELALEVEQLKAINWTVARELVGVLTPDNWEDLMAKGEGLSARQNQRFAKFLANGMTVAEAFKAAKKKGKRAAVTADAEGETIDAKVSASSSTSSTEGVRTLKITMAEDRYRVIEQAMELAKQLAQVESEAAALEFIATEFVTENSDTTADDVLENLAARAAESLSVSGVLEAFLIKARETSTDEEAAQQELADLIEAFQLSSLGEIFADDDDEEDED